jgi:flagella basal body P-ring formation protein FlgA
MPALTRTTVRLLLALWLLSASDAAGQTTVTLRPSARVADNAQILRLGDVADIVGDEGGLADLAIVPGGDRKGGWAKVDIGAVRAALEDADVNWGKLSLRGGTCTVRYGEPRLSTAAASTASAGESSSPDRGFPPPSALDFTGPATLRTVVAAHLAVLYGVKPDRLRLAFDPADGAVLHTPVAGRRVDVELGALASSARVPLTIHLYEADRVVLTRSLSVEAVVYRAVVTAAATIERGRPITAEAINTVEQWLAPSPGGGSPARADQVIGQLAQTRITAGQVIGTAQVAPPLACKRGDSVNVHCLSGSVVVKVKARALAAARDGELVKLELDGSDKPFTARMSGAGTAVLLVGLGGAGAPTADERRTR